MKEIRNIIFDIGNVLIRFDPTEWLINNYGHDKEAMKQSTWKYSRVKNGSFLIMER